MAKLSNKIVIKKISELVAYGNNPRINDEAIDAVAASIQAFAFLIINLICSEFGS